MKTLISRHLSRRLLLGLVTLAVVTVAGCSNKGVKKVTVNGTISYKGQPLRSGMLRFFGPEGAYTAAPIKSDGTFIITDVVPGEVKVCVMETPQGSKSPSSPVSLPDMYHDPETSGLKYTITPDTKELPIEIK